MAEGALMAVFARDTGAGYRAYGLAIEDLTLMCAGLSKPQVERQLVRWDRQGWPRRRPPSPALRAFQGFLNQRRAAVRAR